MEQFDTSLYNEDTLNICMKEFGLEKTIFDKMTAVRNMILSLYNVDTLDICMKEFGSAK